MLDDRRRRHGGVWSCAPCAGRHQEATMSSALERLGRFAARRPWIVIISA